MRIFVADKTNKKMKQLTQEQLEQVYREHPEWTMELKVGKWYHRVGDTNFLMCFQGKIGNYSAYGFNLDGKWSDALGTQEEDQWTPASDAEVASALIAEARKRGFKSNQIKMIGDTLVVGVGDKWKVIFIDGKWATVITPASTLASDIQALKDKYPNYNWTIIAEGK